MNYNIEQLHQYVADENVAALKYLIKEGYAKVKDGKLFSTGKDKNAIIFSAGFWKQRQQARKILLNSLN